MAGTALLCTPLTTRRSKRAFGGGFSSSHMKLSAVCMTLKRVAAGKRGYRKVSRDGGL
jgi:hypothetical protein